MVMFLLLLRQDAVDESKTSRMGITDDSEMARRDVFVVVAVSTVCSRSFLILIPSPSVSSLALLL